MPIITQTTSPADIAKIYAAHGHLCNLEIDPRLSNNDLTQLIHSHAHNLYTDALYQLIPSHPNFDEIVLDTLLPQAESSSGVLNAIVTSGRLSRLRLLPFLGSQFPSVQEHARIALFALELDALNDQQLAEKLDSTIEMILEDMPLVSTLIFHRRTPNRILEILASLGGSIGNLAQERLQSSKST